MPHKRKFTISTYTREPEQHSILDFKPKPPKSSRRPDAEIVNPKAAVHCPGCNRVHVCVDCNSGVHYCKLCGGEWPA